MGRGRQKLRFAKIALLVLLLVVASGSVFSGTTLLFKAEPLEIIGYTNRIALSHDYRYGGNYLRIINLDTGRQVAWSKDADISKLKSIHYLSNGVFQFRDSIIVKDDDSVKAFDIISGKLIWENKNIKIISLQLIVKDDVGYTFDYDSKGSTIHLYSINMNNGALIDHHELSIGQDQYQRKLYDIKGDCALIQVGMDMVYYNFKADKAIWKYELNPYSSNARIVNSCVIASAKIYSKPCTDYIFCVNLTNGKELWDCDGREKYALNENYIYYYHGDPACCKDSSMAIVKRELATGKIIKIDENNEAFSNGEIFNYNKKILYVNCFDSDGNNDYKFRVYDEELGVLNEESICNFHEYTLVESRLYGDYLISMFNNVKTGRAEIFCNRLPDYTPPESTSKPPLDLIGWIIHFILGKLMGTP